MTGKDRLKERRRRVITEDAYLDHLGRGMDDELETIETLGKNTVSETSEYPDQRIRA